MWLALSPLKSSRRQCMSGLSVSVSLSKSRIRLSHAVCRRRISRKGSVSIKIGHVLHRFCLKIPLFIFNVLLFSFSFWAEGRISQKQPGPVHVTNRYDPVQCPAFLFLLLSKLNIQILWLLVLHIFIIKTTGQNRHVLLSSLSLTKELQKTFYHACNIPFS